MVRTGAVQAVLDPDLPLADQIAAVIDAMPEDDHRDRLGRERGGRPVAEEVAAQVVRDAALG
jgi:malonate decarboxylase gamma subunit